MSTEVTQLHNYINTPITDNSFSLLEITSKLIFRLIFPMHKYCISSKQMLSLILEILLRKKMSLSVKFIHVLYCVYHQYILRFINQNLQLFYTVFIHLQKIQSSWFFPPSLIGFAVLSSLFFQKKNYKCFINALVCVHSNLHSIFHYVLIFISYQILQL